MKRLWIFLAGVLAGVAGVTLYYIYGKPVLPSEETYSMSDVQKKFFPNKSLHELLEIPSEDSSKWHRVCVGFRDGEPIYMGAPPYDAILHKKDEYPPVPYYGSADPPGTIRSNNTSTIPAPDSLDGMGITQEIEI